MRRAEILAPPGQGCEYPKSLLPLPPKLIPPIRSYGLPEGEATGEFCSDGVAVGLASSFVAAVEDGAGVGVSAGVADANGVADVSGTAEVTGVADV